MSEERIRPFSNGSQYMDWMGANCDRCTKGYRERPDGEWDTRCDILNALSEANWDDGTIPPSIAVRMGYAARRYCWQCPEVVHTAAWKTEFCRKNPDAPECEGWNNRKRIARRKKGQLELMPV